MLKIALNSHRPDLPIIIGIFDYDDEGIKEYKELHKAFSEKGKHKIHRNKKCAATVIPKIPGREKYYDATNLPIEYIFPEEFVLRKNRTGIGLTFRQKKKITYIEGKIIDEVDSTEPHYRQIVGNKVLFAEQIVPTFPDEAFSNFKHFFDLVEQIL